MIWMSTGPAAAPARSDTEIKSPAVKVILFVSFTAARAPLPKVAVTNVFPGTFLFSTVN